MVKAYKYPIQMSYQFAPALKIVNMELITQIGRLWENILENLHSKIIAKKINTMLTLMMRSVMAYTKEKTDPLSVDIKVNTETITIKTEVFTLKENYFFLHEILENLNNKKIRKAIKLIFVRLALESNCSLDLTYKNNILLLKATTAIRV